VARVCLLQMRDNNNLNILVTLQIIYWRVELWLLITKSDVWPLKHYIQPSTQKLYSSRSIEMYYRKQQVSSYQCSTESLSCCFWNIATYCIKSQFLRGYEVTPLASVHAGNNNDESTDRQNWHST